MAEDDVSSCEEKYGLLYPYLGSERGLTVVFITHDIREAMKLGDRVLVMDQGRAIQLDKPEVILEHPANAFVQELISD